MPHINITLTNSERNDKSIFKLYSNPVHILKRFYI